MGIITNETIPDVTVSDINELYQKVIRAFSKEYSERGNEAWETGFLGDVAAVLYLIRDGVEVSSDTWKGLERSIG